MKTIPFSDLKPEKFYRVEFSNNKKWGFVGVCKDGALNVVAGVITTGNIKDFTFLDEEGNALKPAQWKDKTKCELHFPDGSVLKGDYHAVASGTYKFGEDYVLVLGDSIVKSFEHFKNYGVKTITKLGLALDASQYSTYDIDH